MILAKLKSYAWDLLTLVLLGVIYWIVIADGLRFLVPVLGQRLYKLPIPFASLLRDYEATYRLDLANALAVFLFIAMWNLWGLMLKAWLGTGEAFQHIGWNANVYQKLVNTLGFIILGADAALFYIAMTQMGWSGSSFSLAALLSTVAYVAVLIFVKLVSITLEKRATTGESVV